MSGHGEPWEAWGVLTQTASLASLGCHDPGISPSGLMVPMFQRRFQRLRGGAGPECQTRRTDVKKGGASLVSSFSLSSPFLPGALGLGVRRSHFGIFADMVENHWASLSDLYGGEGLFICSSVQLLIKCLKSGTFIQVFIHSFTQKILKEQLLWARLNPRAFGQDAPHVRPEASSHRGNAAAYAPRARVKAFLLTLSWVRVLF